MSARLPTPPPSPTLRAIVQGAQPVRMRRPRRTFAIVAGLSLLYALSWVTLIRLRGDLPSLPRATWGALAVAWLLGFVLPLATALVPRRAAVLPDAARAGRVTIWALLVLALAAFVGHPRGDLTLIPHGMQQTTHSIVHCLRLGLLVAFVPLMAGLVALRRLLLVGSARLLAAVGAAGGALGGLVLHLVCPIGGAAHVGCGHFGAALVASGVGALLGVLIDRAGR